MRRLRSPTSRSFTEPRPTPAARAAYVLTLAVLEGPTVTIGHVGDSRLYKLTPQGIAQLTHDHSPVGEREDARELTETQAMQHARRNEVYRDVGSEWREPDAANFIEIVFSDLAADSAILLCSDGLSDMVTSLEINRLVRLHAGDPAAAVKALIAAANDAGGKDNITVILAEGREFAHHTPATPIVFPPPTRASHIRRRRGDPGHALPRPYRHQRRTAAGSGTGSSPRHRPGTRKQGPFARLFGSRGLALVVGALLGVSAAAARVPGKALRRPPPRRGRTDGGVRQHLCGPRARGSRRRRARRTRRVRRASRSAGRRRARLARARCGGARRRAEPAPWVSVTAKGAGRSSRIPHPGPCQR